MTRLRRVCDVDIRRHIDDYVSVELTSFVDVTLTPVNDVK